MDAARRAATGRLEADAPGLPVAEVVEEDLKTGRRAREARAPTDARANARMARARRVVKSRCRCRKLI